MAGLAEEHRTQQDPVRAFVKERCILWAEETVKKEDLWAAFMAWLANNQSYGRPIKKEVFFLLRTCFRKRKNSLFYKTQNGARVSDIFTSLIYTCRLAGVDPFHYLTELQKHAAELAANPSEWMPWNCRDAIARPRDA